MSVRVRVRVYATRKPRRREAEEEKCLLPHPGRHQHAAFAQQQDIVN